MVTITLKPLQHRNEECIGLYFANNSSINKIVKKQQGVRWSHTQRCWYLPLNDDAYQAFKKCIHSIAKLDITALRQYLQKKQLLASTAPPQPATSPAKKKAGTKAVGNTAPVATLRQIKMITKLSTANLEQLQLFTEMLQLKAYSTSTIKTYRNELLQLLQTIGQTAVQTLTVAQIKRYMVFAMKEQHITENTAHSRLNALKFYYEQVLGREKFFWDIPRPKKALKLPKVISEEKIIKGLLAVENMKHRTVLLLAYSAGLRVSEVVSLLVTDVNSDRMQLAINGAKGKKDRVVNLSQAILPLLREYYKSYQPKHWLFEGQDKNKHYSTRSAQIIFNDAYKKLGLPSQCSFHSLRHSFATHLLENGTDISYIQQLLGHNDIKTTLRYTQITNKDIGKIESPLDRILRKKGS